MLIRSAPGSGPSLPELYHRLRWVVLVVAISFMILIGRLWQLQLIRGDAYLEEALSNVVQKRYLSSVRGRIVDRRMKLLASNRPAYNIYVEPKYYDEIAPQLVRLLGLTEDEQKEMKERIDAAKDRGLTGPTMVLVDQGDDRAQLVQQESFRMRGIKVYFEAYRHYPHGESAAQVIGYMNKMTRREYQACKAQGCEQDELIGRDGLEARMEPHLRGRKGEEQFVVNARGQRVEGAGAARLIKGQQFTEPDAGDDVVLTLDLQLQQIAEKAVSRHPAAAIAVVEVQTGRILALVSKPSFDSNVMTGKLTKAKEAELKADPREPFVDKTLEQHYPPGSLFKFVTAVAALEDGKITEEEDLHCPGFYERSKQMFRCTSKHGYVHMVTAIKRSCNVYFWKLAERVGLDRIASVARDFGFGAPTGLGLNRDIPGTIPDKAWYRRTSVFKVGHTLNAATGQGDVEVTVMQLVMAYAAIANGGKLYVPQLVDHVRARSGKVLLRYKPKLRHELSVSPGTLELVRAGMEKVVNEQGGTAFNSAHSDVVYYAGKTGTAQVRKRRRNKLRVKGWHPYRDHAWFAAYAPAENPEIAIVVLIEHGGPGGRVAAPVGKKIIEGYFTKVKPAVAAERQKASAPK